MDTPETPGDQPAPAATPPASTPSSPLPPAPSEMAAPRRRRGPLVIGIAVVVVLALVAVGVALGRKGTTSSAGVAPRKLLPPTGGRAQAQPFRVTLEWTAPSGGAPVAGYSIFRGGLPLGRVTATSYTDTKVAPGQRYQYTIQSVARGSASTTSSPLTIRVAVPKPPLSQARLTGYFNVRMTVLSSVGISTKVGSSSREQWKFVPSCPSGPCGVKMIDVVYHHLHGTLRRKGLVYSGTVTGFHGAYCGSRTVHMTSTLVVTIHLTRGKGAVGAWNADAFTATISESVPAGFGCVSAHVGYRVKGHRVL